uniref:RING-CH-type domain-containing protein n=1 Tax=Panagrellus redivivus TaxID=6233 RepID=A0A7E4WCH6_PANRE
MVSDAHLPLTTSHTVKTARCWFCHLVDIVPDERQSVAYPSGYVLYRACRCERYCHFRCLLRHKRIRKCPTCNDDFLGKSDAIQGRVHFEVCRICNLAEFMDGQGGTIDDKKLVRPCRCMSMAHHGCVAAVIDKQRACRVCGERTAYSTYGNFFHFTKQYPFYVGIPILVYAVILGLAAYFIRDLCMSGIGNMRESLVLAGATALFVISTIVFFYWIVYTASVRMPIFKKRYGHVSVYDYKIRGYTSLGNDSKTTSHLTTELSRGFSADSFKATSTPRRSPGSLTAQLVNLESPVLEEALRKSLMADTDDMEAGLKTPQDSDLDSIPLDVPSGSRTTPMVLFNHRMGSIQSFHSNQVATVILSETSDPPSSSLDIITQHASRPV